MNAHYGARPTKRDCRSMRALGCIAIPLLSTPLYLRPQLPPCRASSIRCSDPDGSDSSDVDWDGAWRRLQLESQDEPANALQDAMAELLLAEAQVISAKSELEAANRQKAELQAELEEVQQQQRSLQQQALADAVVLSLAIAALIKLVVLLQESGPASVAGCLLMPLVCASGQIH